MKRKSLGFYLPREGFIHCAPPLDHSFKKISDITAANKKPRKCRLLRLPQRGITDRFVTRALWLNNNNLKDISNIHSFVGKQFQQPEALKWLDLSFNQLYEITKEILQFENLMILYLHGNQIKGLTALSVLRDLKTLRSLTLRGNPIEGIYGYRYLVISLLPQITRFDYCPICSCERENRLCPGFGLNLIREFANSDKPNQTHQ